MPKRKVAVWRKVGRIFVVRPPDWPMATEYSCTEQETLIEWAHNHNYVLKDGNPPKRERYNARYATEV